jgi:hypothetical protein
MDTNLKDFVCVIQARMSSTRLPGKVLIKTNYYDYMPILPANYLSIRRCQGLTLTKGILHESILNADLYNSKDRVNIQYVALSRFEKINQVREKTKTKKSNATRIMPNSQHDFLNLIDNVTKKWNETPQITLLWTNSEDFKKLANEFRTLLQDKLEVGSNRGSQTQTLKDLDTQINKAVENVKFALLAKFGKDKAKAYYSEFGIVKQKNSYKLPTDRNTRLNNVNLLAKGVKSHSLQIADFNNKFFENISTIYANAFEATQKTDSIVANAVGNKNDIRKQLEVILLSLILVIKANYPNTYEGELRGWGFQKEKY